jgi:glycosyltransferase domain-containing protein
MRDFTLVIPTHNRPTMLGALLAYLKAMGVDWPILVLDSSAPDAQKLNVRCIESSELPFEHVDYSDKSVEEKWRLGFHRITTLYCALCADDDIVIVRNVRRCLDVLRANDAASVVQGYSFSFTERPDGYFELNNVPYYTDSIVEAGPLARIAALFARYQAPAYGIFRTRLLQEIFDSLRLLNYILSRELLWSALAVTAGHVIRVPCFSNGRSMGPSGPYEHWHPLEWVCKEPAGLFTEYVHYRGILTASVLARSDNTHSVEETQRILDQIHMRYLVKHAPASAMGFIIEQRLSGTDFEQYWPRSEIQNPLVDAAVIGRNPSVGQDLGPVIWRTDERSYVLHPNFYEPVGIKKPHAQVISSLVEDLDRYSSTSADRPADEMRVQTDS